MKNIAPFFAFARERHTIYLRRQQGRSWPWTDDKILQQFSFCNLFRELDRTTMWFKTNVREPLRASPQVLLATVLFRWFNRTTTGEAIFLQHSLELDKLNAWQHFLQTGETDRLRSTILQYIGPKGPYVTGAYTILGQQGKNKLDGVLACVGDFYETQYSGAPLGRAGMYNWRMVGERLLADPGSYKLEEVWGWLRQVPYLGDFMAYEIVTDLRHTDVLSSAPDIMTWANPGPGAARGLARVYGRPIHGNIIEKLPSKKQMNDEMREILAASQDVRYWPQPKKAGRMNIPAGGPDGVWPAWEMREVEHWLCEYQKYVKVQLGEGRPRAVYRYAS